MTKTNNPSIKGFFFVIVIFLILSYILVSISVWTKALQESERHFSERFRTSNLDLVSTEVTQEKLDRLAKIVVFNVVDELNNYASITPLKPNGASGSPDEFFYVNKTYYELMANGEADTKNFLNSSDNFKPANFYSFADWANKLNASISKTGMQVTAFSLNNFSTWQSAADTIEYSFVFHLVIEEKNGLASITRDYNLHGNTSIEGLVDPAIKRETIKAGAPKPIEKQFFFYPQYANSSDLYPSAVGIASNEGLGWFYGPMVTVQNANNTNASDRKRFILVGNYTEIAGLVSDPNNANDFGASYGQFGAYILTDSPTVVPSACVGHEDEKDTINALHYAGGNCNDPVFDKDYIQTSNPLIVAPNFNVNSGGDCPDGKCILFVTKYSYEDVNADRAKKLGAQPTAYNLEKLRDFSLCSYYVHNYRSPSYFQRLFDDAFYRNSSMLGIETFLIGKYIGGVGTEAGVPLPQPLFSDEKSRADVELFTSVNGDKIRAMPGCRDFNMCAGDSLLGHFRLGENAKKDFLDGKDISCKDGNARCD